MVVVAAAVAFGLGVWVGQDSAGASDTSRASSAQMMPVQETFVETVPLSLIEFSNAGAGVQRVYRFQDGDTTCYLASYGEGLLTCVR